MRTILSTSLLGIMLLPTPTFCDSRKQARSMVISQRGIGATSQTLASQAAAQILARGGSAMDAAIAANAALAAVEPMMNGIGGDLFAIYRDANTGTVTGINASGWAPKAMDIGTVRARGHEQMPQDGIWSVTVPGCVDGWEKLHKRHGRLPWADLFRPAIYYAEHGFPVTEWIQSAWSSSVEKLQADPGARSLFLIDGRAPKVGEVFRNPGLAKALRLIAEQGAGAYYRGPISEAILRTSKRLGGVLESSDLVDFDSEWVEPVSIDYRGWTVYELPPNGQGMAALEMLNIMERYPLERFGADSSEAFHVKIEAQKLAYADLERHLADPRFAKVPVEELTSKAYAARRAESLDMGRAQCRSSAGNPLESSGDTIYLTVVDRDGNIASLIQSIYLAFGSGVTVDDYGFHLHNRGGLFVLDENHPNALAPRKRPFHTIIPGLMEKDGVHIGFGIMGGLNQAQAHAQFVSNVVDHGMNIQEALEAPRFTKLNFGGCDVMIESRLPERTLEDLRKRGHQLEMQGDFAAPMGGGQAVMWDSRTGVKYGASSPRKDGAAAPEPDPYFAGK
ncbi:MAG: gamma-glutamyltransferase [Bryobacteraceae bacterium]|nr:gamma-glutamyltransferase [Bryobacteraceae bacterium]